VENMPFPPSARVVLHPNFPNPFNPETEITFFAPRGQQTTVTVHDLRGREVAQLFDGDASGGRQSLTWNAEGLPSGVYFVRLVSGPDAFHHLYGAFRRRVLSQTPLRRPGCRGR